MSVDSYLYIFEYASEDTSSFDAVLEVRKGRSAASQSP